VNQAGSGTDELPRKQFFILVLTLLAFAAAAIEPPPMPQRSIAPDKKPKGSQFVLNEGDMKLTLFVPDAWKPPVQILTIHFHTAEWIVIQEHVRRAARHPLATFYLGEGSSVYRRAFDDGNRFGRVLQIIEKQVGGPVNELEISSFSAGYGAVREIIKQPEYLARIRTLVLADSMYAALETNSVRKPLAEHIEVWTPFARAAMEGKKTFVITYSSVPTTSYASSSECAQALLETLSVRDADVEAGSIRAASDKDFPLLRRADVGNLHVWGYGGTNAQAHMTHPRHMADLWKAIGK
jgi:hypothetical protein